MQNGLATAVLYPVSVRSDGLKSWFLFSRNYSKNLVLCPAYGHERPIYEVLCWLKMFWVSIGGSQSAHLNGSKNTCVPYIMKTGVTCTEESPWLFEYALWVLIQGTMAACQVLAHTSLPHSNNLFPQEYFPCEMSAFRHHPWKYSFHHMQYIHQQDHTAFNMFIAIRSMEKSEV